MRVEVGDRLEALSSDAAGHARNAHATYVYGRKLVERDEMEKVGWIPSSCLFPSTPSTSTHCSTSAEYSTFTDYAISTDHPCMIAKSMQWTVN